MKILCVTLALSLVACETERINHVVPYVILSSVDENDELYPAVERLREFRGAEIIQFQPDHLSSLKSVLQERQPDYVAVMLRPTELDVNLARSFLMLSTEIDDDPFSDFAYGFITGATGADALTFVENIIKAEESGLAQTSLRVGGLFNHSLKSSLSVTAPSLAPIADNDSAIALSRADPGALAFYQQNTKALENRRVLSIAYQGDAHMLWLFEDGATPWPYDPDKVENPPTPHAGVTSAEIAKLNIYPAVVYSALSQSGAPARILVDHALAPTFGDNGGTLAFHDISPDFSLCLAVLKAGAIGYFAPVGTTNGFFNDEDLYNTFVHDEPLGAIHKRAVDRLVMGFLGNRPRLKLYGAGDADTLGGTLASGSYTPGTFQTSYMISFLANRVYFGDPKLDPFSESRSPKLRLVSTNLTKQTDGSLRVEVMLDKPAQIYPVTDELHHGGTRVYTTVEVPDSFGNSAKVEVLEDDATHPITRQIHALERYRGKTILHLELDIPAPNGIDPLSFKAVLGISRL